MARPTAIVVWFDDNTRYHIDPAAIQSMFLSEGAATDCGHGPPHQLPGPDSPVHGPFPDHAGPPPFAQNSGASGSGGGGSVSAMEGSCYYVNGIIVCP